ncbi:sensor histidine kinase KdpD [Deinococcus sp. JMULE3]|uniref:sensor histidine kinase n=1 Tax=Deinococcus sp. JMULE3 TaxID=2518341 RepID=UPI00157711AE|nr:HAMP domain-containing sensor histidine kinase [Deinococcus sp. JMULE3]NTX99670.1 HAMP domain-containing histidine kinase [Deinococcus sp. JMULE3]
MSAGSNLNAAARPRGLRVRTTLRAQFTLVIFLLAFLPNLVMTLMAQPSLPSGAILAWMVLVGATCALVGFVLSGALLTSVSRLRGEVMSGHFGEPHPDDPSEILSLRQAFTDLLGRLSTEQARRNAFMATLVHDLKTPLIATGHLTKIITTMPVPDAERRMMGEQIQAETARLLALVQQMADAHRFEQEQVQVRVAPADLRALLDEVATRVATQAHERGVQVRVCGRGVAAADAAVLERAVTNLTVNALRYARTHVTLEVTPSGLTVTDDGPGLPAPLDELAQPFNAQPTTIAGKQYTSGTAGLGLFIVRRIAQAHGGDLHYDRVPATPPEHPPAPPPDDQPAPPAALTRFTLSLPEVQP